jgi:hypothetical protein
MIEQVYQVGKFYKVTCVILKGNTEQAGFTAKTPVPVAGPPHDDTEYINFSIRHYHVDWRFTPEKIYQSQIIEGDEEYTQELGQVVGVFAVEKTVVLRLKCRRLFRTYPDQLIAKFIPALQKGFADKSAKNGICPHKGFDLNTLHLDADSCVVCPLHGLKFNTTNWQLVERL